MGTSMSAAIPTRWPTMEAGIHSPRRRTGGFETTSPSNNAWPWGPWGPSSWWGAGGGAGLLEGDQAVPLMLAILAPSPSTPGERLSSPGHVHAGDGSDGCPEARDGPAGPTMPQPGSARGDAGHARRPIYRAARA